MLRSVCARIARSRSIVVPQCTALPHAPLSKRRRHFSSTTSAALPPPDFGASDELDRIGEFQRAAALAADDRLPAAAEQVRSALKFLQFAPPRLSIAARVRLARMERDMGHAAAELAERRIAHASAATLGDAALSAYTAATLACALFLDRKAPECGALIERSMAAFSAAGNHTGAFHLHVVHALSSWHSLGAASASAVDEALRGAMASTSSFADQHAAAQCAGDARLLRAVAAVALSGAHREAGMTQLRTVIEHLEAHAPPAESLPLQLDLMVALVELAAVHTHLGQHQDAYSVLARAVKVANAAALSDTRLVWCLRPLAAASLHLGNTIEAEGLYRSCLSKLRGARPLTAGAQVELLRVAHDYGGMLANVSWNNRSREAEGRTLCADEQERARRRFGEAFAAEAAAAIASGAADSVPPQWALDKYR